MRVAAVDLGASSVRVAARALTTELFRRQAADASVAAMVAEFRQRRDAVLAVVRAEPELEDADQLPADVPAVAKLCDSISTGSNPTDLRAGASVRGSERWTRCWTTSTAG